MKKNDRFDVSRHFVRIAERRADGLVAFEFSVGEPDMMVELIMPAAAFEAFCAARQVTFLESRSRPQGDWDWTLHDATHRRLR